MIESMQKEMSFRNGDGQWNKTLLLVLMSLLSKCSTPTLIVRGPVQLLRHPIQFCKEFDSTGEVLGIKNRRAEIFLVVSNGGLIIYSS